MFHHLKIKGLKYQLPYLLQHLTGIFCRLDIRERLDDDSVFVNQVRGAHYAKRFVAVEGFLLPNVVGLDGGLFGVGEEGERKVEFLLEFFVRGDAVLADADDFRAFFTEMRKEFRKCARLFGAARGVVLGIKIQHNLFAAKFFEAADVAVLIRQRERRRRGVGL